MSEEVRDRRSGISAGYPKDWKQAQRQGLITLESGDRCVSVSLAAPESSDRAEPLLDDTIAAVSREFPGAQVERRADQRVGGLSGPGAVLDVQGAEGTPVRVLITVGVGEEFAYLTQVVLRNPSCDDALLDSQLVVNSIRYSK